MFYEPVYLNNKVKEKKIKEKDKYIHEDYQISFEKVIQRIFFY